MKIVYELFIRLFIIAIRFAGLFNQKAKQWWTGRQNLFSDLEKNINKDQETAWFHCASAGEFEQAKSLIDALKEKYPSCQVVVSFFSPSGYTAGLRYKKADVITYLPVDTASNARRFIAIIQPKLVVFIKYDYWYHHLEACNEKNIPLLLVSAIFREQQIFFKPYGGFHRSMLKFFTHLFVQDEASKDRLAGIEIDHVTVAGDTRFDRVAIITSETADIPFINEFKENKRMMVAGSSWQVDEELLAAVWNKYLDKLLIAPHEISEKNSNRLLDLFAGKAVLYSQLKDGSKNVADYDVLIINNTGMLSRLYRYANITYIGGGFNKSGIHNTLEAAVWSKPVIFGPHYQKFREARELVGLGAGFPVSTKEDLDAVLSKMKDDQFVLQSGKIAGDYVNSNRGATNIIINYIQENRLLTTW